MKTISRNPLKVTDKPNKKFIHNQLDIKLRKFMAEELDTVQKKLKAEKLQALIKYFLKYGRHREKTALSPSPRKATLESLA